MTQTKIFVCSQFTEDTKAWERVKIFRENKRWSQNDLVEQMKKVGSEHGIDTDINISRVNNWENRGNTPNKEDTKLLSLVFGINETDIAPEGCRKR